MKLSDKIKTEAVRRVAEAMAVAADTAPKVRVININQKNNNYEKKIYAIISCSWNAICCYSM